jgi:hypothetical protein
MLRHFLIIIILFFITNWANAQIVVDKGGDSWSTKVDSALVLIKKTSPKHWQMVQESCNHISMWTGKTSTTQPGKGSELGTIVISRDDFKLNSINNIAAVIVHESKHLWISINAVNYSSSNAEEADCYLWELEFLQLIPNVEPWLVQHVFNQFVGNTEPRK